MTVWMPPEWVGGSGSPASPPAPASGDSPVPVPRSAEPAPEPPARGARQPYSWFSPPREPGSSDPAGSVFSDTISATPSRGVREPAPSRRPGAGPDRTGPTDAGRPGGTAAEPMTAGSVPPLPRRVPQVPPPPFGVAVSPGGESLFQPPTRRPRLRESDPSTSAESPDIPRRPAAGGLIAGWNRPAPEEEETPAAGGLAGAEPALAGGVEEPRAGGAFAAWTRQGAEPDEPEQPPAPGPATRRAAELWNRRPEPDAPETPDRPLRIPDAWAAPSSAPAPAAGVACCRVACCRVGCRRLRRLRRLRRRLRPMCRRRRTRGGPAAAGGRIRGASRQRRAGRTTGTGWPGPERTTGRRPVVGTPCCHRWVASRADRTGQPRESTRRRPSCRSGVRRRCGRPRSPARSRPRGAGRRRRPGPAPVGPRTSPARRRGPLRTGPAPAIGGTAAGRGRADRAADRRTAAAVRTDRAGGRALDRGAARRRPVRDGRRRAGRRPLRRLLGHRPARGARTCAARDGRAHPRPRAGDERARRPYRGPRAGAARPGRAHRPAHSGPWAVHGRRRRPAGRRSPTHRPGRGAGDPSPGRARRDRRDLRLDRRPAGHRRAVRRILGPRPGRPCRRAGAPGSGRADRGDRAARRGGVEPRRDRHPGPPAGTAAPGRATRADHGSTRMIGPGPASAPAAGAAASRRAAAAVAAGSARAAGSATGSVPSCAASGRRSSPSAWSCSCWPCTRCGSPT